MIEAAPTKSAHERQSQLDALFADEARKNTHLTLPFLLPTIYFVWVILGDTTDRPAVRTLMGVLLGVVVLRWSLLLALMRPSFLPRVQGATRDLVWRATFVVLTCLTSAAFAATYLAAGPGLDLPQLMRLTMIAAAVCAVGMMNMAPVLRVWLPNWRCSPADM